MQPITVVLRLYGPLGALSFMLWNFQRASLKFPPRLRLIVGIVFPHCRCSWPRLLSFSQPLWFYVIVNGSARVYRHFSHIGVGLWLFSNKMTHCDDWSKDILFVFHAWSLHMVFVEWFNDIPVTPLHLLPRGSHLCGQFHDIAVLSCHMLWDLI